MNNIFIFAYCILMSFSVSSQKNDDTLKPTYIGSGGQKIIVCDSLSFKDDFIPSEFYITADLLIPYTGYLYTDYNGNGVDSSYVFNGKKNGVSKEYRKDDNGKLILRYIKYFNYGYPKIYAFRSFSEKNNSNYSLIYYYEGNNKRKNINIRYKKSIIKVLENTNGKKKKYRFTNIEELREYLNNFSVNNISVNEYCEIINMFEW